MKASFRRPQASVAMFAALLSAFVSATAPAASTGSAPPQNADDSVVTTSAAADIGASSSSSSMPAPTSTVSTLPVAADCGDFSGDGAVTSADALGILRVAVGQASCADCVCDVNVSGGITSTDALAVLRVAVGAANTLDCPLC